MAALSYGGPSPSPLIRVPEVLNVTDRQTDGQTDGDTAWHTWYGNYALCSMTRQKPITKRRADTIRYRFGIADTGIDISRY